MLEYVSVQWVRVILIFVFVGFGSCSCQQQLSSFWVCEVMIQLSSLQYYCHFMLAGILGQQIPRSFYSVLVAGCPEKTCQALIKFLNLAAILTKFSVQCIQVHSTQAFSYFRALFLFAGILAFEILSYGILWNFL